MIRSPRKPVVAADNKILLAVKQYATGEIKKNAELKANQIA